MRVLLYNLLTFYARHVGGNTASMLCFARLSAIFIVIFFCVCVSLFCLLIGFYNNTRPDRDKNKQ